MKHFYCIFIYSKNNHFNFLSVSLILTIIVIKNSSFFNSYYNCSFLYLISTIYLAYISSSQCFKIKDSILSLTITSYSDSISISFFNFINSLQIVCISIFKKNQSLFKTSLSKSSNFSYNYSNCS